jgi:hypothetical protein
MGLSQQLQEGLRTGFFLEYEPYSRYDLRAIFEWFAISALPLAWSWPILIFS